MSSEGLMKSKDRSKDALQDLYQCSKDTFGK